MYDFPDPMLAGGFAESVTAPQDDAWKLSAAIDRSVLEEFMNGGAVSATDLTYPEAPLTVMTVDARSLRADAAVTLCARVEEPLVRKWQKCDPALLGRPCRPGPSVWV